MSRLVLFVLFFAAVFLQAGAYGLTFMLPRLFGAFGANEKAVGGMLLVTAVSTLVAVFFSGHLADWFGRVRTLGLACASIALALFLYARSQSVGPALVGASVLLGAGWGLTYSLAPVVLTRLVRAGERVRYFALLSVFVMAGFGLSPVMASAIEGLGFAVADAFDINAALCTVSAALFFILAAPVRAHSQAAGVEARSSLTLASVAAVLRSTALIPVAMVCLGASVFAGINNFQTVFADTRGLDYSTYFLTYTATVIVFRLLLVGFKGGPSPYLTIAALLSIMCGSVVLFIFSGGNEALYILFAVLFGIGYGASYPILVAMAADDADGGLMPQTLQLFALTYFVGIFGFPLIAGWLIVETGPMPLLVLVAALAGIEAIMAARRARARA
ncbi:MAG: MFS transporter [Proteobacteria bacterium]|nr:MFS transporter [Pseudomonadota bacterium]